MHHHHYRHLLHYLYPPKKHPRPARRSGGELCARTVSLRHLASSVSYWSIHHFPTHTAAAVELRQRQRQESHPSTWRGSQGPGQSWQRTCTGLEVRRTHTLTPKNRPARVAFIAWRTRRNSQSVFSFSFPPIFFYFKIEEMYVHNAVRFTPSIFSTTVAHERCASPMMMVVKRRMAMKSGSLTIKTAAAFFCALPSVNLSPPTSNYPNLRAVHCDAVCF